MAFIHTDSSQYESVAVSGSTAYSTGFDLADAKRSSDGKVYLYFDISTYTSGDFDISLIGDTALPLDASSVVISTAETLSAAGQEFLPVPQDKEYRYYGLKIAGSSPTGTVKVYGSALP